ncbi:hypothetical protein ACRAWF_29300 [Streptomyces sp. L7]
MTTVTSHSSSVRTSCSNAARSVSVTSSVRFNVLTAASTHG